MIMISSNLNYSDCISKYSPIGGLDFYLLLTWSGQGDKAGHKQCKKYKNTQQELENY